MADESVVSPINPANYHSWSGVIKEILRNHDVGFECCIPVVVANVYAGNRIVDVVPLIKLAYKTDSGMTYKDRTTIYSIPVRRIISGGYIISMPIKAGDTGWLIACDRDSALAVKYNNSIKTEDNPGAQPPASLSLHEYASGFFLPDNWANIDGSDSLMLAKYDDEGAIVNSIQIGEDNISINSKTTVNITGEVAIAGSLAVSGESVFAKKVTSKDDIVSVIDSNEVSLRNHTHKYLDDNGIEVVEKETAKPGEDVSPSSFIKVGGATVYNGHSGDVGVTTTRASQSRGEPGTTITFTGVCFSENTSYISSSWSCEIRVDGVVKSYSGLMTTDGRYHYQKCTISITIPETCTESFNCALYNGNFYDSYGTIIWD